MFSQVLYNYETYFGGYSFSLFLSRDDYIDKWYYFYVEILKSILTEKVEDVFLIELPLSIGNISCSINWNV